MKEFLKSVDELPLAIKVILCIPVLDIFYGVCRIINGFINSNSLALIIGILTVFPGVFFMWIIDLVWVIWKGKAFMLF